MSDLREVAVPVATVWTAPDAPRDVDAAAVADLPDVAAWTAGLDPGTRLDLHGRTLTQLLLGEPVLVVEERGGWSRVTAPWQASSADERGYPGWVRTAHLGRVAERAAGPIACVTAPSAACRRDDGQRLTVSFGTVLPVASCGDVTITVLLAGGHRATLERADVRLADDRPAVHPDALLDVAGGFLGLRYLWGGTSAWGLDCSGLVHLVLRSHGVRVPRDAFDMAADAVVEPVPLDAVRPGDLYFFARPGERIYHVGFASRTVGDDGVRWMLHAPEGGGLVEDAPLAPHRAETLVSAARLRADLSEPGDAIAP